MTELKENLKDIFEELASGRIPAVRKVGWLDNRFLDGKWKSMRVIEAAPHALSPVPPEAPCIERGV